MMEEEKMVDLLRHYRHDWMNQVQLLMGYASMGKLNKVQDKLKENMTSIEQERKLTNLDIPKSALWILSFDWTYDNFRLEYQVDGDTKNLSVHDNQLHKQLITIMNTLTTYSDDFELYRGEISIRNIENLDTGIKLVFSGAFRQINKLENQLLAIKGLDDVTVTAIAKEKYQCTITWVCS